MTKNEIKTFILESINQESKCWIHFKLSIRPPSYGRFVAANDFDELWNKSYVRFAFADQIENYEVSENIIYTKMYSIDSLSFIKLTETVC